MNKKVSIQTRISYWAHSARHFMLGPFDGYAVFPLTIFMLHIKLWTFVVLVVALTLSIFLSRAGYNLPVLLRILRVSIGGRQVKRVPGLGLRKIWR